MIFKNDMERLRSQRKYQITKNYVDGYKMNYYKKNVNQNQGMIFIQIECNHNHDLFELFVIDSE